MKFEVIDEIVTLPMTIWQHRQIEGTKSAMFPKRMLLMMQFQCRLFLNRITKYQH